MKSAGNLSKRQSKKEKRLKQREDRKTKQTVRPVRMAVLQPRLDPVLYMPFDATGQSTSIKTLGDVLIAGLTPESQFWVLSSVMKQLDLRLHSIENISHVRAALAISESRMDDTQRSRLWAARFGYPGRDVLARMTREGTAIGLNAPVVLNEDTPIKEKGSFRAKSFTRQPIYDRTGHLLPFQKIVSDGMGGQASMGVESYDGAVGGFVYVCMATGWIEVKLYSHENQYSPLTRRYFNWVQAMNFSRVRELVVDQKITMHDRRVEQLCSEHGATLTVISERTPQEIALAENAVGRVTRLARKLRLMAPHLPDLIWGLCVKYAAYLLRFVQYSPGHEKGTGRTPFESAMGHTPDVTQDGYNIQPFGCPVSYKPGHRQIGRAHV